MPQSAFINPVVLPETLNVAERMFVRCMARGEPCVISESCPAEAINNGKSVNVIRADVIRFFAWGGDENNQIKGNIISLQGAFITGGVNLTLIPLSCALALMNCYFYSPFPAMLTYSAFRSLNLNGSYFPHGLHGDGLRIDGNMFMKKHFASDGEIRMLDANIGGSVHCDGGKFKSKGERAFIADRINVGGNIIMSAGFVAKGEVRLPGANIGGQLQCDGGAFDNEAGTAFFAESINVKGSIFMRGNFSAKGAVRLIGANIGGGLNCSAGTFKNETGCAIVADKMKTGSSVTMGEGFVAEGEVRLLNANIGGQLRCEGGTFRKEKGKAFSADGIIVKDGVFMQNGFRAEGEVRLLGASIGGDFYCGNSKFKNKGDCAFVADGIKVGGNFALQNGFYADGSVWLSAADIGGDLYCNDGKFENGLNAKAARIGKTMHLWGIKGGGTIDLSSAIVDVLADDKKSHENFDFLLGGFLYQRLESPGEVESRIEKWLDKRPKWAGFSPQPFEQAAKVLFAMGKSKDAREVLFGMEQRITREMAKRAAGEKDIPWWNRCKRMAERAWRRTWEATTGYNYRLWRMFWTSAAIAGLGAAVFGAADYAGHIVPHQPVVLASQDYKNIMAKLPQTEAGQKCPAARRPTKVVECLFPDYPRFYAPIFSIDVFIPLFFLHQEQYWYPQPSADAGVLWRVLLPVWFWFEVIAGWVLTSLFVLTITGILSRRQAESK